MSDDGNRTEKGIAPAPFGADAGTADTIEPAPPPSDSQPSASRSLPALDRERYKIQGEVGRGGLGRILRARDEYLDRLVAVKELLAPDPGAQARFVREALITARLQHPAIVPIYDAGQSDDKGPFYAMKLVAGSSLAEALAEKKTLEERLSLLPSVIAVVDAMAYAHSENIIHRDLKPQNVLVGKYGETVLIDWGLAKDLSEVDQSTPYRASAAASSSTETMDGAVMGTPAFMPPEQAAGEEVDEKADVYALGAMLYFLIAGVPPHSGRNMDDMLLKIVSGDIIPVQQREERCPADLAAIVAKAMAMKPENRYPSAGELAADLKKFQTGQLVGAHEYTLGERLRRWLKKHRGIVAVATAALVVLIAYGVWSIARIRAREAEAVAAAARADANAAEANKQKDKVLAQSMLVRARQYAATGHTAEEIAVLRALAQSGPDAQRMAIEDGGLIWKAHQRLAMALGSGAGLTYRTADGARFIASVPGALVTWDVQTGNERARLAIAGDTARFGQILAISPAGQLAIVRACTAQGAGCGVTSILDGTVYVPRETTTLSLVEIATGKQLVQWDGAKQERLDRRAVAFATNDSAFVIRTDGRVWLHDQVINTKDTTDFVTPCDGALAVASFRRFAIACKDHVLLVTDKTGVEILRGKPPARLVFIGEDRLLAIGDTLKLWDVSRGELRGEGKLILGAAQREEEEESDEMPWSYFAPGVAKERGGENLVPQIRVGHSTSIVARTSLLPPPPRIGGAGAVLSLEGHDWQSLVVQDDLVRYALVDQLVPAEPPDRCLSRVGGERHATTALDNGERLLIDQQELALGLEAAPPEGYRHTTTAEVPVRQLRPLVAAEVDACLIWSAWSFGAHRVDGGVIPPLAGAASDGYGGIVVAGTRESFRIGRDGKRTNFDMAAAPLIAPSGAYVASADAHTRTLAITQVASGKATRLWTAPPGTTPADLEWVAKDVVAAFGHVVSLDPALAPRAYDRNLTTDPRSPFGVKVIGADVRVENVADGKQIAKHAGFATAAYPMPDDTGRVIIQAEDKRDVVSPDGKRVTLAPLAGEIVGYDIVGNLLVAHGKTRSDVWDLATGQLLAIPKTSNLVAIIDDVLWTIEGKSNLVRAKRDGSQRREVALSTAGLPFDKIVDEVTISDDRKRISARYALGDELHAYAIWDAETGVLLWVGPPTASIVGDWIVSGGRAFVPVFDLAAVLHDSGARTNLRVCEKDLRVVPVTPPPAPDTYWAPPAACATR